MNAGSHHSDDHPGALREHRIMAIASGGGHWVQLMRLRPAFTGSHVTYVTVKAAYRSDIGDEPFHVIHDATRWSRFGLLRTAARLAWLMIRIRPHVVVTTGAAPGYFGLMFGRLLGARTVWIDSVANTDELSLSGQQAARWASLWLTQWPNLAREDGPQFAGAVL